MQRRSKTITGRRPRGRTTLSARGRATTPRRSRSTKPAARRMTGKRTTSTRSTSRRGTTRRTTRMETTPSGIKKSPGRLGAKTTTDHGTIRHWAEERQGTPSTVTRTAREGDPGILRIDFPGFSGKGSLSPIPWDEWFSKFDELNLAFLYQERAANGKLSRFFKLVRR